MFCRKNKIPPRKDEVLMQNIVPLKCPKSNNTSLFYKYSKTKDGSRKYLCRKCHHQFAPDKPSSKKTAKYPRCPVCGKASFLYHDYEYYSNYRCCDKKCNHSFFVPKPTAILSTSMSKLVGKTNFKRMRYPVHIILSALSMFFLGKNSFRNISLILKTTFNVEVSHTTISNWCRKFAPLFHNISLELIPMLNFNSDEWHVDETVVKIAGEKYYIWFVIDSETRFILGFHLTPYRDSRQAFALLNSVRNLGTPSAIVSDRYSAYKVPVKSLFGYSVKHIRVESFKNDISNNLIESFHHQFKAWYKAKQGFASFESANNLISMFVFFYNFVRPHSSLNGWTPAQVAGLNLTPKEKKKYLLVA
jgi:transposase-like protein